MAYQLRKSDGTILTTIVDGALDTTHSGLSFPGPNYVGYGEKLNENLLYLLENFASNTAPSSTNLEGQLWYNKSNKALYVYNGTAYASVAGTTNSGTQPAIAKDGDIWFNTTTNQASIYNNGTFNLIGPLYTKSQGVSGAIPVTVQDSFAVGVSHNIIEITAGETVIATISGDQSFSPLTAIPGFTTINPGITFSSLIPTAILNSNLVGNVTGNLTGDVAGNVVATTLTGTLTGNVVGNLTGDVTATTLRGSLVGNFDSTTGYAVNFSTANAIIGGGYISNLTSMGVGSVTATNLVSTDTQTTNFSTGNAVITGGSTTGLSAVSAFNGTFNNLSTGNLIITGGSATGLTQSSATTLYATNFSSPNVIVTGGSLTGMSALTAGSATVTDLSTGNAFITGGSISGVSTLSASAITATTLTATTASFTNGSIANLTGSNVTLTTANIVSATAPTKTYSDNTTSLATTAFVQSVLPQGVILMWSGSTSNVPAGWQLCDGTNSTPNLRGQFIIGAGGTYAVGATGGNTFVGIGINNLPSHAHSMSLSGTSGEGGAHAHSATSSSTSTSQSTSASQSTSTSTSTVTDPGHTHTTVQMIGDNAIDGVDSTTRYSGDHHNEARNTGSSTTGITVATATNTTTATQTNTATQTSTSTSVAAVGAHTHALSLTGNTGVVGAGQSIDIRPPYYALCYIMKMY